MIMESAETADNHCCENFNQNSHNFILAAYNHLALNAFAIWLMSLRTLSSVILTLLIIFFWTIQADQSRLWDGCTSLKGSVVEFQSYQFRQINPDLHESEIEEDNTQESFNRINSGRSIPTSLTFVKANYNVIWVSIVSIQADQSRQEFSAFGLVVSLVKFQSYQFRQINPDHLQCSRRQHVD